MLQIQSIKIELTEMREGQEYWQIELTAREGSREQNGVQIELLETVKTLKRYGVPDVKTAWAYVTNFVNDMQEE